MTPWLAFLCVLLVGHCDAGSKKPPPTTTTTKTPVPWNPPYISPNSDTQTIVNAYKAALGECTTNKNNADFVRNVGLTMAEGVLSAIPVIGGMAGVAKEWANFLIPSNKNCYMDKFQDMIVDIIGERVDIAHVQTLTNDLQSWKDMLGHIADYHDSTTQGWLQDTMANMMGEYRNFFNDYSPKRFSAIPVRDYVNLRVAIYEDMLHYDKIDAGAHKKHAVQLINHGAKYIKEVAELAAQYTTSRVCKKHGYESSRGCTSGYSGRSLNSIETEMDIGNRGYLFPDEIFEDCDIYVIPQHTGSCTTGQAFYTRGDANQKARQIAKRDLSNMTPITAWTGLISKLCEMMKESANSVAECSKSLDKISIPGTSSLDGYYASHRRAYGNMLGATRRAG